MARAIIRYSAHARPGEDMRGGIREAMNPKGQPELFEERGTALYEADDAPLEEIAKALARIADVVEEYGSAPEAFDQLWVCLYNPPRSD